MRKSIARGKGCRMSENKCDVAVIARLISDRQRRAPFHPIRIDGAPISIAQAYRLQNGFVEALGQGEPLTVLGYKVGLTETEIQERLGINEPIVGCLLEGLMSPSGVCVNATEFAGLALECEIALIIDRPVSLETSRLTWNDIRSVHAAFELLDDHGASLDQMDVPSIIADNAWHAGVILGEGIPVSRNWKFSAPSGGLSRNGKLAAAIGPNPILGGPLNAANWVRNFLARDGRHLVAGDMIMTGALIGPMRFAESSSLRFEIDGLPPVELDLRFP